MVPGQVGFLGHINRLSPSSTIQAWDCAGANMIAIRERSGRGNGWGCFPEEKSKETKQERRKRMRPAKYSQNQPAPWTKPQLSGRS